jgi:hypothetical protein
VRHKDKTDDKNIDYEADTRTNVTQAKKFNGSNKLVVKISVQNKNTH